MFYCKHLLKNVYRLIFSPFVYSVYSLYCLFRIWPSKTMLEIQPDITRQMTVSGCLSSVGWNGVTYVTYVLYNVQYRPLLLTLYKEQRSVTDTFLSTFDRFSHVSCTLFDICRGGHALFSCCAFIICSFQKGPYQVLNFV